MSGSAFWAIQQAVYSCLNGDATLMARIQGVFDSVDEDQAFPYVTIGDVTSIPMRTQSRFGEECTLTLHIWSRYAGFKEAAEILDDLNRLLADQDLTVTGWDAAGSFYDFSETFRDPDGITRHVVARYRILLQKGE